MKDILEKISSYNIFNYLLPGILFAVISSKFTDFPLTQENLIEGFFVYYFIGLIISRIGSLIIEPLMKKILKIKLADYEDYVKACKKDEKLELFSEINNMFRTIISMLILILILKLYAYIENCFPIVKNYSMYLLFLLLIILFFFSYKKQTRYIIKRVKIAKEINNEQN